MPPRWFKHWLGCGPPSPTFLLRHQMIQMSIGTANSSLLTCRRVNWNSEPEFWTSSFSVSYSLQINALGCPLFSPWIALMLLDAGFGFNKKFSSWKRGPETQPLFCTIQLPPSIIAIRVAESSKPRNRLDSTRWWWVYAHVGIFALGTPSSQKMSISVESATWCQVGGLLFQGDDWGPALFKRVSKEIEENYEHSFICLQRPLPSGLLTAVWLSKAFLNWNASKMRNLEPCND